MVDAAPGLALPLLDAGAGVAIVAIVAAEGGGRYRSWCSKIVSGTLAR